MISIKGLNKTYASGTKAIDNLDLEIKQGEILALLGANGAGKSSTIKVLTTLSGFDDGEVLVAGFNVDTAPEKVRQSIGYVAQETGVDYFLTGRENLELQGHLYRMTNKDIQSRISELAEYFTLSEHLDKLVSTYSGGMRRKLDIATALIHRPKILFLDEPTLGLDTQSRQNLWTYIRKLNEELGLTFLLTTHYLEEADKLAHRVAIIDNGAIKAIGNPEDLKSEISGDVVTLEMIEPKDKTALSTTLAPNDFVRANQWEEDKLHLYVSNGASAIVKLIEDCQIEGADILNVAFSRPTLDDVFIQYTGSSIDSASDSGEEKWWEKWAGKGGGGSWGNKWKDEESETSEDESSNKTWSEGEATEWHKNKSWSKDDSAKWEDNKHWNEQESAAWHNKSEDGKGDKGDKTPSSKDQKPSKEWSKDDNNSDKSQQSQQHWDKK